MIDRWLQSGSDSPWEDVTFQAFFYLVSDLPIKSDTIFLALRYLTAVLAKSKLASDNAIVSLEEKEHLIAGSCILLAWKIFEDRSDTRIRMKCPIISDAIFKKFYPNYGSIRLTAPKTFAIQKIDTKDHQAEPPSEKKSRSITLSRSLSSERDDERPRPSPDTPHSAAGLMFKRSINELGSDARSRRQVPSTTKPITDNTLSSAYASCLGFSSPVRKPAKTGASVVTDQKSDNSTISRSTKFVKRPVKENKDMGNNSTIQSTIKQTSTATVSKQPISPDSTEPDCREIIQAAVVSSKSKGHDRDVDTAIMGLSPIHVVCEKRHDETQVDHRRTSSKNVQIEKVRAVATPVKPSQPDRSIRSPSTIEEGEVVVNSDIDPTDSEKPRVVDLTDRVAPNEVTIIENNDSDEIEITSETSRTHKYGHIDPIDVEASRTDVNSKDKIDQIIDLSDKAIVPKNDNATDSPIICDDGISTPLDNHVRDTTLNKYEISLEDVPDEPTHHGTTRREKLMFHLYKPTTLYDGPFEYMDERTLERRKRQMINLYSNSLTGLERRICELFGYDLPVLKRPSLADDWKGHDVVHDWGILEIIIDAVRASLTHQKDRSLQQRSSSVVESDADRASRIAAKIAATKVDIPTEYMDFLDTVVESTIHDPAMSDYLVEQASIIAMGYFCSPSILKYTDLQIAYSVVLWCQLYLTPDALVMSRIDLDEYYSESVYSTPGLHPKVLGQCLNDISQVFRNKIKI